MHFRPRYSLLTLLLLTAGIAVGIKLWRGPHRIMLTSQWSPYGDNLFAIFPSAEQAAKDWGPMQFECEYVRNLSSAQYIALIGWPDEKSPVQLVPKSNADAAKAYLYSRWQAGSAIAKRDEFVVCWFFENEKHVQKQDFWRHQWKGYLLTNQRRLMSYESWTADRLVYQVELQEIEDFALRACIETERDKLP